MLLILFSSYLTGILPLLFMRALLFSLNVQVVLKVWVPLNQVNMNKEGVPGKWSVLGGQFLHMNQEGPFL